MLGHAHAIRTSKGHLRPASKGRPRRGQPSSARALHWPERGGSQSHIWQQRRARALTTLTQACGTGTNSNHIACARRRWGAGTSRMLRGLCARVLLFHFNGLRATSQTNRSIKRRPTAAARRRSLLVMGPELHLDDVPVPHDSREGAAPVGEVERVVHEARPDLAAVLLLELVRHLGSPESHAH